MPDGQEVGSDYVHVPPLPASDEIFKTLLKFYKSIAPKGKPLQYHTYGFLKDEDNPEPFDPTTAAPDSIQAMVHPLARVVAFCNDKETAHWHYVTQGFSDLYGTEITNPTGKSGRGFELTMRVLKGDEREPPLWPLGLLQYLAGYVFSSGKVFQPNEHVDLNAPIIPNDKRCTNRAIGFALDMDFRPLRTASGEIELLQIVGLTADEYRQMVNWQVDKFLGLMARHNPMLVIDPYRTSILERPDVKTFIEEGEKSDGSSVGALHVNALNVRTQNGIAEISLEKAAVVDLCTAMRGRIAFGRHFKLLGDNLSVVFESGDDSKMLEAPDARQHVVQLSNTTAEEIANSVVAQPGRYELTTFPELKFVITA